MTAEELDDLLAGIAPVIRSYVTTAFADLQKQVAAIDAKAAVPGPGIGSLLLSADGRLVAHLTDGRTLDVGPVPVKEPVPGPAGRDADPVKVFALETELAALRAETAAKAEEWRLDRAQIAEDLATVKRFGDDLSARVDALKALPVPRDGQDGASVTVDDVAPLIEATVQKSLSTLPLPVVAPVVDVEALVASHVERAVSALPVPKDGASVTTSDVAPLIAAEVYKAVAAIPVPKDGASGADGQSVSIDDVAPLIAIELQKAVAALPPARDGKDGSSVDPFVVETLVETLVATRVERAVAALPVSKDGLDGKDGTSVAAEDLDALVSLHVEKAVAALPPAAAGQDGASVTVGDVTPLILAEVQKAVALIPAGKDGQPGPAGADGSSVTVDDVAPLIAGEVAKAVSAVPVPKDGRDGVGVSGAFIDRDGQLALTLSDGAVKHLGTIVGSDGRDVDMAEVSRLIAKELESWPRPADGKDGFGFDDLSVVHDGLRGFTFQFTRGEQVKSFQFTIPSVIFQGVFGKDLSGLNDRDLETHPYERGDSVTSSGCTWIAKQTTSMKPDFTPASAKVWTLSVKSGREGREGKPGPVGPKGSKGDPGGVYK